MNKTNTYFAAFQYDGDDDYDYTVYDTFTLIISYIYIYDN